MQLNKLVGLAVAALMLASCAPEPVPIDYGKDECANCKMRIVQPKYGSEIVTKKGKVYKFDAPECMIAFLLDGKTVAEQEVALMLVPDLETEKFIAAETAFFLRSDNLKSPMGLNVAAFATKEAAEARQRDLKGDLLLWQAFKDLVKKEWLSETTETD